MADSELRVVDEGITCLHTGGANPIVDIIFVHGLGGHPQKTWSTEPSEPTITGEPRFRIRKAISKAFKFPRPRGSVTAPPQAASALHSMFWPYHLLRVDIPDVRILTYGYYSSPASPSQDNLYTLSNNMLIRVANARTGAPTRPLIFVCHSLGGILTKFMLKLSQDCTSGANAWMKAVRDSTAGVIFFATPHSGSDLASWGELLRRITSLFAVTNPSLLAALNSQADNGQLEELRKSFVKMLGPSSQGKFHVFSFRETKPLVNGPVGPLAQLVVPLASSDIVSDWATDLTVAANHRDICRFAGANDSKYQTFIQVLDGFLNDIKRAGASTRPQTLLTPDVQTFLRSQASPQDKSCDWILGHPKFKDWIQSENIHTIHVVGEPGCGKSTAAAWLFRNCSRWCPESRRCAIFSFQSGRKDNNASSAWASFMGQLSGKDVPSVEEPRDWSHLVSESRFPPGLKGICAVYLIDAVDECDQSTALDFLQSLSELVRESENGLAKMLLFSRHTMLSGIDGCFGPGVVHRIDMNSEDQQIQNVGRYITTEVKRLCDVRPGLMEFREHIISELVQRSSGIYLLPSLTLKSLAKSKGSPSDIRKLLGGLPQNLLAIYSDALQKVRLEDRPRVSAMLLWLVFAMCPLRESEISAAIEFCSGKRNFKSLKDLDDEVSRDILGTSGVSELVGPLIKTTADGFVSMVHSSAREYILSLAANPDGDTRVALADNSWVWESLITYSRGEGDLPALAAHALSSHCLKLADFVDDETFLLSVSQMGSDATSRSRRSQKPHNGVLSLIKYSVENLPDHIRQCSSLAFYIDAVLSEPWDPFATFLQRKPKGDIWMRTFWVLRDPTQQYEHDLMPLHFCCALNLAPCVRKLLPRSGFPRRSGNWTGSEIPRNGVISQYLTAVDVASMFGNVEILAILCEEHQTPISRNFPGRISDSSISPQAFSTGAFVTHAFGTDAFGTDAFTIPSVSNDELAVTRAARSRRSENVDETRGNGEFSRNRSILSWLVSGRRARNTINAAVPDDPNREPRSYQPLFTATRYGQVAAIDYLVGRGCDIFEEDEDGDNGDTRDDTTKPRRIALEVAIDGKNHAAASALYRHHTRDNASRRKILERFITSQARGENQNLDRLAYLVGLFPELWIPALEVGTGDEPLKTSILHIAATADSVEVFDFLTNLWRKANPSLHHFPLDSRGRHPLHYAAAARQSRTIESIIQADPDTRMCVDSQDRNCLYYAASGIKLPWGDKYLGETPLQDVARFLVGNIKSTEACDFLIRSAIISLTEVACSKPTAATDNKMLESMEQKTKALMSLGTPSFCMGPDFPHKAVASFSFPLKLALEISTRDAYEFKDLEGQNLLHAAAAASSPWKGESGFIELVEAFRGRIQEGDARGKTALRIVLEHAISEDKDEILSRVSLLLKAGSSIDCPEDTTTNSEPLIVTAAGVVINRHSASMSRIRMRQSTPGLIQAILSGPEITATTVVEKIPDEILIKLIVALVNSSAWSRNDAIDSKRLNMDYSILLASLSTRQHSYLHHYVCNEKQTPAELVIFYYNHLSLQELEQIVNNNLRYEEIENALFLVEKKKHDDRALEELERLCKARLEKNKKR